MTGSNRPSIGALLYFLAALMLALYYAFAAMQGNFGVFKRVEVEAEGAALRAELEQLQIDIDRMENLTTRLSDTYLDLDLLDEQARDILGLLRTDEIVIH